MKIKTNEIKGEIFEKYGEEYTKFIIGYKVTNSNLENLIICLGGIMIKQTKMFKYYEIEGNQLKLMLIS